ncbi:MAG: hypothetical protein Kilf2KO_46660 [Rhodospirillales bacterium]
MLRILLTCCLLVLPLAAKAESKSPVVLTVSGEVDLPNRGALNPESDALMARIAEPFEQARSFTLEDLATLPQQSVTLHYPNWPQPISFTGPSLLSVLKAAGATGEKLEMMALDGYTAAFTQDLIQGGTFILAMEAGGTPLAHRRSRAAVAGLPARRGRTGLSRRRRRRPGLGPVPHQRAQLVGQDAWRPRRIAFVAAATACYSRRTAAGAGGPGRPLVIGSV